jgi:hypothetical protein
LDVLFEKSKTGEKIEMLINGELVGVLDSISGQPISAALNRQQSFDAVVAGCHYEGGQPCLVIKGNYLLEKGNPAIEIPKPPPREPTGEWTTFYSKIAGVTHQRGGAPHPQSILPNCRACEALVLKREPENPVDPQAVAVYRRDGFQLGYLRSELAQSVSQHLQNGYRYYAQISEVTGVAGR